MWMARIGFIGVGAMGSSIASRLVNGHDLLVSDHNPAAAAELVTQGLDSRHRKRSLRSAGPSSSAFPALPR